MNPKAFIPLIAGLAIGGFALKVGLDTLQSAKGEPTVTTKIWAAKIDIPRGTTVSEEMIAPIELPNDFVPAGAFTDQKDLIGRVARIDTGAGVWLLKENILPEGQLARVHVPPGLRAIAVRIDESSGVDYHLEPGCRVDVMGYFSTRQSGSQETFARTILQDVEVAAVGPRISAVVGEGEERSTRPTRAVTLLVKPNEAEMVLLAEKRGTIKLSMRSEDDNSTIDTPASYTETELLHPGSTAEANGSDAGPSPIADFLANLAAHNPEPEPAQKPEPVTAPVAQVTPTQTNEPPAEPEWVVYVWRGDRLEVVRFKNASSRERVNAPESSMGPMTNPAQPTPPQQAVSPQPPVPAQQSSAPAKDVNTKEFVQDLADEG